LVFFARTRTVYEVPLVRPEIVWVPALDVEKLVQFVPSREYS
jgi:hypothetical protein